MVEATHTEQPTGSASAPARRRSAVFEVRWRNPERGLVDYVSAVWARKLSLLLVTVACGLVGLLYALTKPNNYASQGRLMVHGSDYSGSTADAAVSLLGASRILPDQVVTAVEIVRSRVVLEHVVDSVGYEQILRPYKPGVGAVRPTGLVDWAIDAMHRVQARWLLPAGIDFAKYSPEILRDAAIDTLDFNLVVLPAMRGTTIMLSYLHSSPAAAQEVLTAVVDASIRRYSEVVAPPEGKDWLDGKVLQAEAEEVAARQALSEFAQEHGTTDLKLEIATLTNTLASLSGNLRVARITLLENEEVLGKFRGEIEGVGQWLRETTQEVYAPEMVRQAARQKLVELRTIAAAEEAGPKLTKIDLQIATLEKQLHGMGEAEPSRTVSLRPNPRWALLDDNIRRREVGQIGAKAQIPLYDEQLIELRKTLEEHRELQRDVARLHSRAAEAEAQHKRLREISKTFQINNELDTRGLTNLRVVEPPILPRIKEGPQRGRLLLGAMFGGFTLFVTFLLVRVRLSHELVRQSDVAFAIGRSDVVSLPKLTSRNLQRFDEARRRGWE